MKCLIINGSPHKGYTWKIVEYVREKLQAMGEIEFEEIMLMDADIPLCKGCFSCFYNGEQTCPHSDKVSPIVEKLLSADALIITSPVYALHFAASRLNQSSGSLTFIAHSHRAPSRSEHRYGAGV